MNFLLYIDPGTGSMLFTLVLGLVSVLFFIWKKFQIKLSFLFHGGKADAQAEKDRKGIVIFSDHKRYWNVFEPICEEFEKREKKLEYWTASSDDPALSRNFRYVTCRFIGEGNAAFAKLNLLNADICLSTTPGLEVYQWKRSKHTSFYVHILHAVGSAAGYRMFGIDCYDALLLSGEFQVREVRALEEMRHLCAKEIEIVGCPWLDTMRDRLLKTGNPEKPENATVLLAPSWGTGSILNRFGERIIDSLLATGYQIIIRPHPQSFTAEKEMIERLMEKYPQSEKLSWNKDNDNFDVLRKADVMISDYSGVVFDYALVFDKPVIYTEASFDSAPYDAAWFQEPLWKFRVYPTLGIPLREEDFPQLKELIEKVRKDETLQKGRDKARREAWAHIGHGAELTADYLIRKEEEILKNSSEKEQK